MSINDKLNCFYDNTALAAIPTSDVIDLGDDVTTRNVGGKDPVFLVIQTGGVTPTDAGSDATLRFQLASDSAAALNASPTVHIDTGVLSFATVAVANKVLLVAPLPFGNYERYLGLLATVASGPFTAGSVRAFLTRDPQFWTALGSNNPSSHN